MFGISTCYILSHTHTNTDTYTRAHTHTHTHTHAPTHANPKTMKMKKIKVDKAILGRVGESNLHFIKFRMKNTPQISLLTPENIFGSNKNNN